MLCMFLFPYPKTGTVNTVYIYRTVKKVREFPVPSRVVATKLSLGGNNDVINELFLPRGCLVSDIPAGDGKIREPFLRCVCSLHQEGGHTYTASQESLKRSTGKSMSFNEIKIHI
jgi:hypothetical protein